MIVKIKAKRNLNRKSKKTKQHIVEVLTKKQLEQIKYIDNPRNKAIIQILLNTGVRVTELINLNYGDVFDDIRKKHVKSVILITGKGNKTRKVPINSVVQAAIRSIDQYNRKVLKVCKINYLMPFFISRIATRMSRQSIHAITTKELNTHPHILRHTFATLTQNKTNNIKTTADLLGHSNINTTARYYTGSNLETLVDAVNLLVENIPIPTQHLKLVVNQ